MRWDVTYTHVFCALRRAARSVSHMFSRMLWLCAHKEWYCQTGLRFSIYACHLQLTYCLNQARYRDTPPSFWTGSTRTIRRSSFNEAFRTRPGVASWRGGATRTGSDAATCVLPSASRTRHPFPCSSGSAPRTCPDDASHASNVASPASVSRPWWWAHSGTAAIVQSGRVHVSIAILASDGGLKQFVELPRPASLLLPSLLAAFSVINGIPHSCCCGAARQHLWFEQMKGYPWFESSLLSFSHHSARFRCWKHLSSLMCATSWEIHCARSRRHVHHMHSRTHTQCSEAGMEEHRLCNRHDGTRVRSQSFWKHHSAESTFDQLRSWQIAVGWTVSEASCYLHHSFTTSSPSRQVALSLHSSQSSPSSPWLARYLSFRLVLSETCQRLSLPFSPALLHLS